MNNIALFVKDFQKGTELSDRLATVNINITFAESIYDLPDQCQIGLIAVSYTHLTLPTKRIV